MHCKTVKERYHNPCKRRRVVQIELGSEDSMIERAPIHGAGVQSALAGRSRACEGALGPHFEIYDETIVSNRRIACLTPWLPVRT